MKQKFASQQLKRFISDYQHQDHNETLVLSRVDHGKRSYWLHSPSSSDPIPADAETVGTVADVKSYYAD